MTRCNKMRIEVQILAVEQVARLANRFCAGALYQFHTERRWTFGFRDLPTRIQTTVSRWQSVQLVPPALCAFVCFESGRVCHFMPCDAAATTSCVVLSVLRVMPERRDRLFVLLVLLVACSLGLNACSRSQRTFRRREEVFYLTLGGMDEDLSSPSPRGQRDDRIGDSHFIDRLPHRTLRRAFGPGVCLSPSQKARLDCWSPGKRRGVCSESRRRCERIGRGSPPASCS